MADDYGLDGEKKLSQFNGGVAKAIRLDNLLTKYNNASFNPLAFDYEMQSFNFRIMFDAMVRLFKEAIGKADDEEKVNCMRKIAAMTHFINHFPIAVKDANNKIVINQINWKIFNENLDDLENDIRIILDEHELDSPTKRRYMGL